MRLKVIQELHQAGIEPDAWMFGHFADPKEYQKLVGEVRKNGRDNVGVIISDFDATSKQIAEAIKACANIPGVIGYAAGSAVFWDAISDYHKRDATRLQAKNRIAQEFMRLYQIYKQTKASTSRTEQTESVGLGDETTPSEHSWVSQAAQDSQALSDVPSQDNEVKAAPEALTEPQDAKPSADQSAQEQSRPRKGLMGKLFKRS